VNPADDDPKSSSLKLLPHQAALVDTFFNLDSKRIILLRADAGLGKTAALIALAGRLLRERPTARVILLAPGALRAQFVRTLRDVGTPALSVDRYQFRELLDSRPASELWPPGIVNVLSLEFARQDDIRSALAATPRRRRAVGCSRATRPARYARGEA
jgi:hypothetical protein